MPFFLTAKKKENGGNKAKKKHPKKPTIKQTKNKNPK